MLFLVVPAIEIYVIIQVGALLGTWLTLGVIGVTALAGAWLARSQGVAVIKQLQSSISSGVGAGTAIVEGVLVLAAGITLLAPGFLTDSIGLCLLMPPLRRALATRLARNWKVGGISATSGMSGGFSRSPADDSDDLPPGVIDV